MLHSTPSSSAACGALARHGYRENRVRARLLLESGCQVAQAGWQVGYRHPANFSTAFSRYFGYAPKTVGRAGV